VTEGEDQGALGGRRAVDCIQHPFLVLRRLGPVSLLARVLDGVADDDPDRCGDRDGIAVPRDETTGRAEDGPYEDHRRIDREDVYPVLESPEGGRVERLGDVDRPGQRERAEGHRRHGRPAEPLS